MRSAGWLLGVVLFALCGVGQPRADDLRERSATELSATELGERHFHQLYGFDAFEAYRTSKGPAEASFVVMRRWREGEAEVMVDVRTPGPFSKWAMLMLHNVTRSDDLFAYVPDWRRVRRMPQLMLQHPIFDLITLSDVRPVAPGELQFTELGEEEVEGEPCVLLEARPLHPGLGFDRAELAVSPRSGFALVTRIFRSGRQMREIRISPEDLHDFQGRVLPARRRILIDNDETPTVLELVNLMQEPSVPEGFFSKHTLRAQRFPSF